MSTQDKTAPNKAAPPVSAISGLAGYGSWTFASKVYAQAVQLAVFIFAARVLAPAEFGFFAFVSAITVVLVVLSEGGLREFILKSRDSTKRLNEIATVALLVSAGFTFIAFIVAAALVFYLDGTWEGYLIALFSLWIMPAALSAIYEGVLVSRREIKAQSLLRILAETCGIIVTIAGLSLGWNVAALIAGRLSMQILYLVSAMYVTGWVPALRFEMGFTRELIDFTRHILLNRVTLQIRSYAGTLAIGAFLGLTEAGFYRAAERIVAAVSELIGDAARVLAWTVFRHADSQTENGGSNFNAVGKAATKFFVALLALSAPVFIGLALVADHAVVLLLGEKWAPAAIIVALLSIRQLFLMPSFITEALLSITGNIKKMPPVVIFNALVVVTMIALCAPMGIVAAALGQIAAAIIAFATTIHLQGRHGGITWPPVFRAAIIIAMGNGGMAALVIWLAGVANDLQWSALATLALQATSGAVFYACFLALIWRAGLGGFHTPHKAAVSEPEILMTEARTP